MKKIYTTYFLLFCFVQLALSFHSAAQCVDGNGPTPVAYDTTIYFEPGVSSTQVKFPQLDPESGMLTCVKLRVTITGIVDTVYMQNLTYSTQTAKFNYDRTDQMLGPGLGSGMSNSSNVQYGLYTVTSFDGDFTTGTDYAAIPRDTVLHKTIERQLTDSTEIAQFYGHDSVTYNYNIDVKAIASMTGGNSMFLVRTSAMVRFRFEYCRCDKVTLPVSLKNFAVTKTGTQSANLSWEGNNDNYVYAYDVQVSRDGKQFSTVATMDRKYVAAPAYLYSYGAKGNEYGRFYFRVRQRWQNGHVRFTPVKVVEFTNPVLANISLYPNPSKGSVGLKFLNGRGGKIAVQVSNASGQQVLTKEWQVAETDYKVIGTLLPGMYWVKITDVASKASCVKQLVVQ